MTLELTVPMPLAALDSVMPLHVVVGADGRVRHAAPTFRKICPLPEPVGCRLFDLVEVERPMSLVDAADLAVLCGARLRLRFRDQPGSSFKGLVVPLAGSTGYLVDLSFGISVNAAVADHDLTAADFAHSDPTIEMLYLAEANAAAMSEARRLIHRLERSRSAAEEASLTDGLTGLGNRRALEGWVAALIHAGEPFALLTADLDFFKSVNDTHGHGTGDEVLRIAALRMRRQLRKIDKLARVGGDEFVILVNAPFGEHEIDRLADRLINAIAAPIRAGDADCRISVSIGASVSTRFAVPSLKAMLHEADDALYTVKRTGRGRAMISEG